MEFPEAYATIVKRSVERNTKELPTILSCLDFESLNCLEIGAGPLARLAAKISGFAKHIFCIENNKQTIKAIEKVIREQGLEKKITPVFYSPPIPYKLPFKDKEFDIVYGAWLPHKTATNPEFLDEITRVSRKHILLVMPGIKGDEPKLVSIVRPGELERRMQYRKQIKTYLESKGYDVDAKDEILRLDFQSEIEIRDVFYCMAFKNELTEPQKEKVNKFLGSRIHNFQDGFYCVYGTRID
ncbi:methyltransferase domain-containing protein [Candidatus Pacearchaeota archaeon]|nr:methyltransferase domain-containing protein [Candidatus Pacearchaeota archaeon]